MRFVCLPMHPCPAKPHRGVKLNRAELVVCKVRTYLFRCVRRVTRQGWWLDVKTFTKYRLKSKRIKATNVYLVINKSLGEVLAAD